MRHPGPLTVSVETALDAAAAVGVAAASTRSCHEPDRLRRTAYRPSLVVLPRASPVHGVQAAPSQRRPMTVTVRAT